MEFGPVFVSSQNRVDPLENPTAGYVLTDLVSSAGWGRGASPITMVLAVENLFDRAYLDHLSRLRPYGVLSPGRNVRFQVEVPLRR